MPQAYHQWTVIKWYKLLFLNYKAPIIIFDSWYSGSDHALWLRLWWKELDMVGAVGK